MKHPYKGKPSRIVPVIEAGDAFVDAVYCKPPSALSRSVWMEKLVKLTDSNVSEANAVEKIAAMAIDLILITSCDENGVPTFVNDDREFLQEKLEVHHHDMMVQAASDILGNIPKQILDGMLMDMLEDEKEEKKDKVDKADDDKDDNQEDDESEKGKLEPE